MNPVGGLIGSFIGLLIPAFFLWIVYKVLGKSLQAVHKWLLLATAYVTFLVSLAASVVLSGRDSGVGVVLLGALAGLFISLPALLLAKLIGRIQSLETKVSQLEAAPNPGPAPDSQRASASSAGEA